MPADHTRVTIMLNKKIEKLLRATQAKAITATQSSISFSQIINDALARQYKMKDYVYK